MESGKRSRKITSQIQGLKKDSEENFTRREAIPEEKSFIKRDSEENFTRREAIPEEKPFIKRDSEERVGSPLKQHQKSPHRPFRARTPRKVQEDENPKEEEVFVPEKGLDRQTRKSIEKLGLNVLCGVIANKIYTFVSDDMGVVSCIVSSQEFEDTNYSKSEKMSFEDCDGYSWAYELSIPQSSGIVFICQDVLHILSMDGAKYQAERYKIEDTEELANSFENSKKHRLETTIYPLFCIEDVLDNPKSCVHNAAIVTDRLRDSECKAVYEDLENLVDKCTQIIETSQDFSIIYTELIDNIVNSMYQAQAQEQELYEKRNREYEKVVNKIKLHNHQLDNITVIANRLYSHVEKSDKILSELLRSIKKLEIINSKITG